MGPLFSLVCPCFRKNVIVTCKIVSFLCSLDNFPQKNVIVFIFGNQISKWHSFEKGGIFDLLFIVYIVTREKTQKFLQHIFHLHKYTHLAHPIGFFCLTNFAGMKNLGYHVWFLFGATSGVDSYSRHFGVINY